MKTQSIIRHWIARPPTDWELVSLARLNLLLVGGDEATSVAIRALIPALKGPVCSLGASQGLALPPVTHHGSLILTDVSELPLSEQLRLLVWLNDNDNRARVISTSRRPLISMVVGGDFLPTLYYRLNTVYIDLTAGAILSP